MKTIAQIKLQTNGHIRIISTKGSMTIDRDNNRYNVYGDSFGSKYENSITAAINTVFIHLNNHITKII